MKNHEAIQLNNQAVEFLQAGSIVQAFDALSAASHLIASAGADHKHVDTDNSTYRFTWADCRAAIVSSVATGRNGRDAASSCTQDDSHTMTTSTMTSNHGALTPTPFSENRTNPEKSGARVEPSTIPKRKSRVLLNVDGVPFLFLRALRVSTPSGVDLDHLCPCGYAWVVWYNLAICCSVLGTTLGERGFTLLQTAFDLYNRVQCRVDNEPPQKQWNTLQMAVLNNQACIYREFCMSEAVTESLRRLSETLDESPFVQGRDRETFLLNLQIIRSCQTLASAA